MSASEHNSPLIQYGIYIYSNWVSTLWQWSVDLYRNRKETAICTKGETIRNTIQKTQNYKTLENKHTKREIKHGKKYEKQVEYIENTK